MAAYGTQQSSVYPESYVGFDSITKQIEKKLVKRGFQFNIICVGQYTLQQLSSAENCWANSVQARPVSASRPSSTPSSPRT
jgi:septin family protein